jgi:phosphoheptose isomerase
MILTRDVLILDEDISAVETIDDLIATLKRFRSMAPLVDSTAAVLINALSSGHKILTCGNGGSAADALHMSEELLGRYKRKRAALPAICLAADPTLLTCIGNDYGFNNLFARQIEGLGYSGDILVLFSSSGNSINQLNAVEAARRKGVVTIALLGKDGGQMAGTTDYEVVVPSAEAARVQEVHTLVLHSWLDRIDLAFAATA